MIAEMSSSGTITLRAENSVEAYALKHWTDEALVMQNDIHHAEQCHWRGSKLIVSCEIKPQEQS